MKLLSIRVTHTENCPILNYGHVIYINEERKTERSLELNYENGMKLLRRLEKRFNKFAEMGVNPYDNSICYKELCIIFE